MSEIEPLVATIDADGKVYFERVPDRVEISDELLLNADRAIVEVDYQNFMFTFRCENGVAVYHATRLTPRLNHDCELVSWTPAQGTGT